jgi:hypothetical protein
MAAPSDGVAVKMQNHLPMLLLCPQRGHLLVDLFELALQTKPRFARSVYMCNDCIDLCQSASRDSVLSEAPKRTRVKVCPFSLLSCVHTQ